METYIPRSGQKEGSVDLEPEDEELIAALIDFDENAYTRLMGKYHAAMMRTAKRFVPIQELAEDVVQETWLAVLQGIHRFEQRSSLKTWIFTILTNRARTRAQQAARFMLFSDWEINLAREEEPIPEMDSRWTTVPRGCVRWQWTSVPIHDLLDDYIVRKEVQAQIQRIIASLPANQCAVITLRDIEGLSADAVCRILGITDSNQRVLLHRARLKVRNELGTIYLA